MVPPARLERATHSLEGCCSIQLSYGSINHQLNELNVLDDFILTINSLNLNILPSRLPFHDFYRK